MSEMPDAMRWAPPRDEPPPVESSDWQRAVEERWREVDAPAEPRPPHAHPVDHWATD
jgi:hypothetical protein